jgi:hypothetical protein
VVSSVFSLSFNLFLPHLLPHPLASAFSAQTILGNTAQSGRHG